VTGSTSRRIRPAVRDSDASRGYAILPEAGPDEPIWEYDAKTPAPDPAGHPPARAGTGVTLWLPAQGSD
jgi:hypothetical protein